MKFIFALCSSFIFLLSSLSVFAQTASTALTNQGVIEMHKAGLSSDVILTSIETSVCKFNVTPTGLVTLKKSGIDESVIKAMIEKQSGSPAKPAAAKAVAVSTSEAKPVVESSSRSLVLLNHVYLLTAKKDAQPLEKLVAGIRSRQGFSGGKILLQVDGDKSGLRIESDQINSFLINTGSDALPELVLYQLKPVKGKREVVTMAASSFSGMKTGESVISLDISKESAGVYKITPGRKLLPGEYFFTGKPSTGSTAVDAFAFGVN
ncbi:hypothetical protein [Dyadobacter sp. Leaf189]|uniref:hypothetical protein n=1 Tax=Dyadobacter sp. Leaf189 TaxID=1736295 RepID=UPI0006F8977F|nr:hypothetical protein [Dyadobacter sp. Leaf189]KQS33811.1 hypothetical protein ASG33_07120 [Dyadobacter sp. Leaf189]